MTDRDFSTRTEGEGETLDMPEGYQPFTSGQVLGERYQVLEMLGRGGMGEVWQAFDLKLRVEVALKALRPEFFKSERRLELLRQEVRAAREVMSPNVCRIFDLIEIEGRELVSMEYVDGATLLGVLQERGPLDLKEAQDIASQFLAGLEAIHKVGLVHRDIKPENIMLTRAGRVVVMDFGLARQEVEGGGSVSGTPAYMAPEQAAGQTVDARADVYAAGVVLAEMVSPDGIKSYESRQSVWEGVRSEPANLPDSPWAPALKRAVAKDREGRFNTARTLTRALEDVTLRVEGAEDLHPYPGLASYTEEDAEYFFGREAEVEQMWRKLEGPHLLGIVGPSGAGKTSFIRAGVIPNAGPGWAIATCNPGNAAFLSLGRALIPELSGDTDAMEALLQPEDLDGMVSAITGWRRRHEHALLIVDQFEELFTQNTAETQARFAELLGRLVLEADVFVLLSMRDDFFFHCHGFEALKPVVTDLTLLGPPAGAALRRALVRPATKCGYRFEDDELVEEMLAEVEGERGALPLLAFAAAQLWEQRDRETGHLTRQAYQDIGGVGGALARHAEATIDHIGTERLVLVRELFRNLVTAEGTRAVREWSELLSVFDTGGVSREGINPSPTKEGATAREEMSPTPTNGIAVADEVLLELIGARLLTSYEVREDEQVPTRRVEIIHESLLANWPRLVRWQTQDADAAQLRDQLRRAARTWDEQGRTDDTLWTGSAYREFASWRERYPGGLSEAEEEYAAAMTSLATRQRRRRRIAVTTVISVLVAGLAVVASFWQRSVNETHRAEAQKLLALGQLELESDPTAALAWARASLGISDTHEGRVFALRALSKGPMVRALMMESQLGVVHGAAFSPDGQWAALRGYEKLKVAHISGGPPVLVDTFPSFGFRTIHSFFDVTSQRLGAQKGEEIRTYSLPDFKELSKHKLDPRPPTVFATNRGGILIVRKPSSAQLQLWNFDSPPEPLMTGKGFGSIDFDPEGEWAVYVSRDDRRHIYLKSLIDPASPPREIHVHDTPVSRILLHPELEWFAVRERESRTISIWPLDGKGDTPLRSFESRGTPHLTIDRRGTRIIEGGMIDGHPTVYAWDLRLPADAGPLVLRSRLGAEDFNGISVDTSGRWVVAGLINSAAFWPLPESPVARFQAVGTLFYSISFTPDGRFLAVPSISSDGVRMQAVSGGDSTRHILSGRGYVMLKMDPRGRVVVAAGAAPAVVVVCALDGSDPTPLKGLDPSTVPFALAYEPDRELVAAGVFKGKADQKVIGVWDLRDGSMQLLGPTEEAGEGFAGGYTGLDFLPDGSLLSSSKEGGLRRWDLDDGSSDLLLSADVQLMAVTPDGNTSVFSAIGSDLQLDLFALDLTTDEVRPLTNFYGDFYGGIAVAPGSDVIAAARRDGIIQVGRLSGGDPHIIFGHESSVLGLAFSPDGRFLASVDEGGAIRVRPVPDMTEPPPHTLPYDELLAKLSSITNLRVVRDEQSPTGWKQEVGPFPGWAEVPEW